MQFLVANAAVGIALVACLVAEVAFCDGQLWDMGHGAARARHWVR